MDANSPFDSILGTNFVPSESNVQLIKAYLIEPLSEITQLDLEISRLPAKRDGIYARIQPYQALLVRTGYMPLGRGLTPIESDDSDLLVTAFCPNLETLECKMWPCFSDEALETLIIRRTSPKFQGSILRRVAVNFAQYPARQMTLDLWKSLENVVDGCLEVDLKYLTDEREVKISAWSGVGTAEMVPEWAVEGI